ncbi:MAG: DUF1223 domain-containing protein [Pseudorhodobacter sp.]|nr:DUF1223 domain-containing protein [Pseudorhodobacter sp.]
MRYFVSAVCGLWLALGGPAPAQTAISEPVVVVELYTSQGCSSCPPADAYLAMLATDPRVIALALHVDYWDYIGWADSFADPRFTARQKAYAYAAGSRTIYTPQMIVAGQERLEGNQPEKVAGLIKSHLKKPFPVTLTLQRSGNRLRIMAETRAPLSRSVRVQLVRYQPVATVSIEHGENAGQTMTYRNIVTSWQMLGNWSGNVPLAMEAQADGDQPVVVILQEDGPANILAAARIE